MVVRAVGDIDMSSAHVLDEALLAAIDGINQHGLVIADPISSL